MLIPLTSSRIKVHVSIPSGMTIPELSIVAVNLLLFNIFVSNFGSRANQGEKLNHVFRGCDRVKDLRTNMSIPWTKSTHDSALSCCLPVREWLDKLFGKRVCLTHQ